MHRARTFLLLTCLLAGACRAAPGKDEAERALVALRPALDSVPVSRRVWADGPPWFSCAEVLAKLKSKVDTAAVRARIGNWHTLVLADWITLRDTAAGRVTEPGWCRATLRDEPARLAAGWRPIAGDSLESGGVAKGWTVHAGMQRVSVAEPPVSIGRDSARVAYLLTVQPDANGAALGAGQDTLRRSALLVREGGSWRAVLLEKSGR